MSRTVSRHQSLPFPLWDYHIQPQGILSDSKNSHKSGQHSRIQLISKNQVLPPISIGLTVVPQLGGRYVSELRRDTALQ